MSFLFSLSIFLSICTLLQSGMYVYHTEFANNIYLPLESPIGVETDDTSLSSQLSWKAGILIAAHDSLLYLAFRYVLLIPNPKRSIPSHFLSLTSFGCEILAVPSNYFFTYKLKPDTGFVPNTQTERMHCCVLNKYSNLFYINTREMLLQGM